MVYDILHETGLGRFYDMEAHPGVQQDDGVEAGAYDFLADPDVHRQLLDFTDGKTSRVTFLLPGIHCVACVWLLERLYKLHDGIGRPEVQFTKKTVSIQFDEERVTLVELAKLLHRIGYPPSFRLQDLDRPTETHAHRKAWLQLGIAGFAFGNVMLLSFPSYLGLEGAESMALRNLFGYISLILALPVLLFSAQDYFRSAWLGLRQKEISIEVPIALGLLALFGQSVWDIFRGTGEGYLDSLAGLVFFLLIGKSFQRRSFDALSFDRDYKSYFPIAALRTNTDGSQRSVSLNRIVVGDRLRIRNGELIPADSVLIEGPGLLDYSFVTGESRPDSQIPGDYLYAGGRHYGEPIDIEVVKEVSQSYLTSLWNHQSFRKSNERTLDRATTRVSKCFTVAILFIATATAVFWVFVDPSRAVRAFTAILIVACPCALALSAPFAFGNALRHLRTQGLFLKNGNVVEGMARARQLVFDKTGTLTHGGLGAVHFDGQVLSETMETAISAMCSASTHPLSRGIATLLTVPPARLAGFQELPGKGLEAWHDDQHLRLGSRDWLASCGLDVSATSAAGSECWLAVDQQVLGVFRFEDQIRAGMGPALSDLGSEYTIRVLSGDAPEGLGLVGDLLNADTILQARQSPADKLREVEHLQSNGDTVMMFGDGLNDAGALQQSDVGIAVTEDIQSFTPACDVIMNAADLHRLPAVLRFSRMTMKVVYLSFTVSLLYNVLGVSVAASGRLSPLFAAILMPISSVTIILLAVGGTAWAARKAGLREDAPCM